MSLSRTFVGFSSTDIHYYRMMLAWKEHEHIDFNFVNCQLSQEVHSTDEAYIKRRCRERIDMAGTFISLVGQDTRYKHTYVRWELEVAREKNCRIIAVNLDGTRMRNANTCPPVIDNVGAIFVPFSARIVSHALRNWKQQASGNWYYYPEVYKQLGYM